MATEAGHRTAAQRFCDSLFARAGREFALVAACCRWPPDEARRQAETILRAPLDWARVLRLAERHRVTGLVAAALRDEPRVETEAAQALAMSAARIHRQNVMHVAVALRVARALEGSGIPFVVLKGAPLAMLAFGSIAVRQMRDFDLLIDVGDLRATETLLQSLGFEREGGDALSSRQTKAWQRFRKHHEFVHRQTGVRLELHWRAFDNAELGQTSLHDVQWVEVGPGQRLPTLPSRELVLMLCAHGASHAWFRLKWLADVAAFVGKMTEAEVADLVGHARERDLDRPVEQALLLCSALFGMEHAVAASHSTGVGRWLAGVARDALLTDVARSKSPEADFVPRRLTASRFLLRRSWRYRVEEARVKAASPADWSTLPVPDRLHFVYPLLRVPLWVRRRWFPQRTR